MLSLKPADIIFTGFHRGERVDRPEFMPLRDVLDVPLGHITDRYSLPWALRNFQPENSAIWGPALRHDHGLEVGIYARRKVDRRLSEDMERVGIHAGWRWFTFTGVRIGS